MNEIKDDKLKDLFSRMPLDAPSMSFENNLMKKIRAEQLLIERNKKRLSILYVSIGIVAMLVLPIVLLYFMDISILEYIPDTKDYIAEYFQFPIIKINTTQSLYLFITIGATTLLLIDAVIRKLISKRKNKE